LRNDHNACLRHFSSTLKSSHRPAHQVLFSPNIYNTSPLPLLSSLTPTPFPHPSSLPILFPSSKATSNPTPRRPITHDISTSPSSARPFLALPRSFNGSIPAPSIFASSSPHPTSTLVLARERERVLVLACLLPVDVCFLLYGWQRMGWWKRMGKGDREDEGG